MASTISPPPSPLPNRHKLNSSFNGTTVTHITHKSNLEAGQRRVEVQTVWNTEDKLGTGAYGVVWRQRTNTGKLRAVKIISRDRLNIQEVESLIELQDHPDLFILFFGWFEDIARDTIHIAMEYIQHGDLGKYIAEYKTKVDAKQITSQILEGLVVLHERAICHRDLKPQNILVASLSPIWVKITDFGISKRWVGTSLKTHCGTAIYRSPEQLGILPNQYRAPGNSYTNNIDMWALGAIVHEMLTLEIPFRDTYTHNDSDLTLSIPEDTEHNVDMGLLYGYCCGVKPFPCGSLRRDGVSEAGIDFVKCLMAVDPGKRSSAVVALSSQWLIEISSTSEVALPEPVPTRHSPASALSCPEVPLPVDEIRKQEVEVEEHEAPVLQEVTRTGKKEKRPGKRQYGPLHDLETIQIAPPGPTVSSSRQRLGSNKEQHYQDRGMRSSSAKTSWTAQSQGRSSSHTSSGKRASGKAHGMAVGGSKVDSESTKAPTEPRSTSLSPIAARFLSPSPSEDKQAGKQEIEVEEREALVAQEVTGTTKKEMMSEQRQHARLDGLPSNQLEHSGTTRTSSKQRHDSSREQDYFSGAKDSRMVSPSAERNRFLQQQGHRRSSTESVDLSAQGHRRSSTKSGNRAAGDVLLANVGRRMVESGRSTTLDTRHQESRAGPSDRNKYDQVKEKPYFKGFATDAAYVAPVEEVDDSYKVKEMSGEGKHRREEKGTAQSYRKKYEVTEDSHPKDIVIEAAEAVPMMAETNSYAVEEKAFEADYPPNESTTGPSYYNCSDVEMLDAPEELDHSLIAIHSNMTHERDLAIAVTEEGASDRADDSMKDRGESAKVESIHQGRPSVALEMRMEQKIFDTEELVANKVPESEAPESLPRPGAIKNRSSNQLYNSEMGRSAKELLSSSGKQQRGNGENRVAKLYQPNDKRQGTGHRADQAVESYEVQSHDASYKNQARGKRVNQATELYQVSDKNQARGKQVNQAAEPYQSQLDPGLQQNQNQFPQPSEPNAKHFTSTEIEVPKTETEEPQRIKHYPTPTAQQQGRGGYHTAGPYQSYLDSDPHQNRGQLPQESEQNTTHYPSITVAVKIPETEQSQRQWQPNHGQQQVQRQSPQPPQPYPGSYHSSSQSIKSDPNLDMHRTVSMLDPGPEFGPGPQQYPTHSQVPWPNHKMQQSVGEPKSAQRAQRVELGPPKGPSRHGDWEDFGGRKSPTKATVASPVAQGYYTADQRESEGRRPNFERTESTWEGYRGLSRQDEPYDLEERGHYGKMISGRSTESSRDEFGGPSHGIATYIATSAREPYQGFSMRYGGTMDHHKFPSRDDHHTSKTIDERGFHDVHESTFPQPDSIVTNTPEAPPAQPVDTDDHSRWRQWVDGVKESWRKTVRK